jgi:hypothetical protein
MPNVTLYRGGSFTYEGKRYEKGVPTQVAPAIAQYLISTGRFTDAGSPPPVVAKTANPARNIVKLSDSVKEEAEKQAAKKEKAKDLADKQKEFTALVSEFKTNLPDFEDVKAVRKFAKDEYGVVLFKVKLPDLIDELAFTLAEQETEAKSPKEKTSEKKALNKKTAVKV